MWESWAPSGVHSSARRAAEGHLVKNKKKKIVFPYSLHIHRGEPTWSTPETPGFTRPSWFFIQVSNRKHSAEWLFGHRGGFKAKPESIKTSPLNTKNTETWFYTAFRSETSLWKEGDFWPQSAGWLTTSNCSPKSDSWSFCYNLKRTWTQRSSHVSNHHQKMATFDWLVDSKMKESVLSPQTRYKSLTSDHFLLFQMRLKSVTPLSVFWLPGPWSFPKPDQIVTKCWIYGQHPANNNIHLNLCWVVCHGMWVDMWRPQTSMHSGFYWPSVSCILEGSLKWSSAAHLFVHQMSSVNLAFL